MRVIIRKSSSTKSERIFAEMLKKNHILFQHHKKIDGREIDFIIGNYAIEIDGHIQSSIRNSWLVKCGFIPVHYTNNAILNNLSEVEKSIVSKYGIFTKTSRKS